MRTNVSGPILVLGGTGFVGSYIIQELIRRDLNFQIIATTTRDLNTFEFHNDKVKWLQIVFEEETNGRISNLLDKSKPSIIINTLVVGSVKCEENPELAYFLNAELNNKIVNWILSNKSPENLIEYYLLSSSFVFDAIQELPNEETTPKPTKVYGKTKLQGENYLRKVKSLSSIIRVTTVWGEKLLPFQHSNLLIDVFEKAADPEFALFSNVYRTPTIASQVAESIVSYILSDIIYPVVHITEGQEYSFAEFINMINNPEVKKIQQREYPGKNIPHHLGLQTKYPEISSNLNIKKYLENLEEI